MVVTRRQRAMAGQPLMQAQPEIQRMRRARRWVKRYKPTDTAHRHRLPDSQPKTQQVVSYYRRG